MTTGRDRDFTFFRPGRASGRWRADDQSALIVGRDDTLHIKGENTLCVDKSGPARTRRRETSLPLKWKAAKPELLEVDVPLKDATPGTLLLEIHQYGMEKPDTLDLDAYAEAASLEHLTLSAGDREAILKGTRLDEVAKVTLNGIAWTPARAGAGAGIRSVDAEHRGIRRSNSNPASRTRAKVQLRDGRQLKVPVTVNAPRPQVTLLSKGTQDDSQPTPSPVHLGSPDDLPLGSRLVFFLKSVVPQNFPRNENVEVAAADGSFRTVLSLADGSLMLEDIRPRWEAWSRWRASVPRRLGRCGRARSRPTEWRETGCRWGRWCACRLSRSFVARTRPPSPAR